jgi:hypothetical protein
MSGALTVTATDRAGARKNADHSRKAGLPPQKSADWPAPIRGFLEIRGSQRPLCQEPIR